MSESERIEAAARVLFDWDHIGTRSWDSALGSTQKHFRAEAAAVLAAADGVHPEPDNAHERRRDELIVNLRNHAIVGGREWMDEAADMLAEDRLILAVRGDGVHPDTARDVLSPGMWRYYMLGARSNDRTHAWLALEKHDKLLRSLAGLGSEETN